MKTTVGIVFASMLVAPCALAWADSGRASLSGTTGHSDIIGSIEFKDTKEGLHVSGSLQNVPPGTHGFHIHQYGSCEQDGKAAGDHFNPAGTKHGDVVTNGLHEAHAGDLGNVIVSQDGSAVIDVTVPGIGILDGEYMIGGRSIVLHEKIDDFGQPLGNAGARIACGVILVTDR